MSIRSLFTRKAAVVEAPAPAPLISDEKLAVATVILKRVGLIDPEIYGFDRSIQRLGSYFGNRFEWTERSSKMRFLIRLDPERTHVRSITVVTITDGENSRYSNSLIAQANEELKALFTI